MSTDELDGRDALSRDRVDEEDGTEDRSRMSFLDHLDELRRRIVYSLYALIASCAVTFYFWDKLYVFLVSYFLSHGGQLIFTKPMAGFVFSLKISLLGGLLIASPFIFSQLWFFVAPGLYANEKKWAIPFILMSSFFFVLGAAFSHYVVFPLTWRFFVSFTTDILTFAPRVEPAFSIYLRLLLAFGLVFQMPTLVLFLARMGLVSARFLIRNFKFAFLIMVIVSAVVTPDGGGVSLVAMTGPMILLYGLSIILAWIFGKKKDPEST